MSSVTASAPGKLMLFGEHAVVHGYPCLVTAVDLRYHASVSYMNDQPAVVRIQRGEYAHTVPLSEVGHVMEKDTAFVEAVITRIHQHSPITQSLLVETHGPTISYGLGSSSAITAATAGALNELLNLQLTRRQLFDLCYQAVLDAQDGVASGFDVASAIYGGTLYFVTGGKEITPLDVSYLPILIAFSGEKVGTVNLVKQVTALKEAHPLIINPIFTQIEQIVEYARHDLSTANWAALGRLATLNHYALESLGVSTDRLSELVRTANTNGAWGAKLSGAGGGDCIYAVVNDSLRDEVERKLTQTLDQQGGGGQIVNLATNTEGVRIE